MSKKIVKAGVLIFLLALPAFIFMFLHLFADNRFKLPYYAPKYDTTGVVMKNGKDTVFHQVPAFSLTDQDGNNVTEANVKGKIYVAQFFDTNDDSLSRRLAVQLGRINNEFFNKKNVLILSHTVNTKTDSVAVLKKYERQYIAKTGKWLLLTGDSREMELLAKRGYRLPELDKSTISLETFLPSKQLLLIDPSGYIRGVYDGTEPLEIDRLRAEIRVLLDIIEN
jgi:protein SCO1